MTDQSNRDDRTHILQQTAHICLHRTVSFYHFKLHHIVLHLLGILVKSSHLYAIQIMQKELHNVKQGNSADNVGGK